MTTQSSPASPNENALVVTDPQKLKQELALSDPTDTQTGAGAASPELEKRADDFVTTLLAAEAGDIPAAQARKQAVETMAADVQKKAAYQSEMLKQPISILSQRGAEGGEVAKSIINLKLQVEELDPGKFDFEAGWFSRALGRLPGVGTPMKRYFSKYESAQTTISAIIRSLEQGRDQLTRDNITLGEDQKQLSTTAQKLEKAIQLGQLIDQKLQYKLDREIEPASAKQKFVSEELLFPLRQRIMDLQQQLVVSQQGILALELIVRNNKELIRGVNRSLNVTVTALQTAVTVAMALENQRIVLDKIESIGKTTSDLIAGTAARLKTQGTQIQQRAATAQLDMSALKTAFADIQTAIQDISNFRQKALPQMASTIGELDEMSKKVGQEIKKIDQGKSARPEISIEVE